MKNKQAGRGEKQASPAQQRVAESKRAPAKRDGEPETQSAQMGSCPQLSQSQKGRTHLGGAPLWPGPLALLIDGENVSPQDVDEIMTCAQTYGEARIRRLYGNWARAPMTRWREVGWQHGLTPIHHQPPITGKNTCDIALVVDAMQFCEEGIRTFALASSDSDYVPLVRRLRERGCVVVGMGKKETHLSFKRVCTHFVELGRTVAPSALGNNPTPVSPGGPCRPSQPQDQTASLSVEHRLLCAYQEATKQTAGEWVSLPVLARCLRQEMGESEQVDPHGLLAALLEMVPVLFTWKLGKGGIPLLRERGQEAEKAPSSPKRR